MKRELLLALIGLFAITGVAACDASAGPVDPGDDDTVLVPDTTTNPDTNNGPDAVKTDDGNKPDITPPPDVPDVDYCEAIDDDLDDDEGLCRTWQAFEYNGDNVNGEIFVTCQNTATGCEVTQKNSKVFYIGYVVFVATKFPAVGTPLTKDTDDGDKVTMWVEDIEMDPTLHINAKKPTGINTYILSR